MKGVKELIMFEYTLSVWEKTKKDLDRLAYLCAVVTQLIYIAYLGYALLTAAGPLWANIPLAVISVSYFVFFLFVNKTDEKKLKRRVKHLYSRLKSLVKLFTLGVSLYGIYLTANRVTLVAIIFSAFMLVGWLIGVVLDIAIEVVERRVDLLISAIMSDMNIVISTVNFFKKRQGEEVEQISEKNREKLQAIKEERQLQLKAERERREHAAAQRKIEVKQEKKQLKKDKKQAKKQAKQEIAAAKAEKKKKKKAEQ